MASRRASSTGSSSTSTRASSREPGRLADVAGAEGGSGEHELEVERRGRVALPGAGPRAGVRGRGRRRACRRRPAPATRTSSPPGRRVVVGASRRAALRGGLGGDVGPGGQATASALDQPLGGLGRLAGGLRQIGGQLAHRAGQAGVGALDRWPGPRGELSPLRRQEVAQHGLSRDARGGTGTRRRRPR